jgi:hypothetical protein
MREKFQCERTISRHEAEQAKFPLWEMMGLQEVRAQEEILKAAAINGFQALPDDIFFDWGRRREPECFVLRAWCLAKRVDVEVTPKVIKAARELLDWTIGDLCFHSQLGYSTVADYEREGRQHTWKSTIQKMVAALESGGVEFISGGVRLRA